MSDLAIEPVIPFLTAITITRLRVDELKEMFESSLGPDGKSVADEWIVVDTRIEGEEDDGTEAVVAAWPGAKMYKFPWIDDFAAARNAGIAHATGKWCLTVDTDYRMVNPEALITALNELEDHPQSHDVNLIATYVGATDKTERRFRQLNCWRNKINILYSGAIHEHLQLPKLINGGHHKVGEPSLFQFMHTPFTTSGMAERLQRNLTALQKLPIDDQTRIEYEVRTLVALELQLEADSVAEWLYTQPALYSRVPADVILRLAQNRIRTGAHAEALNLLVNATQRELDALPIWTGLAFLSLAHLWDELSHPPEHHQLHRLLAADAFELLRVTRHMTFLPPDATARWSLVQTNAQMLGIVLP